MSSTEREISTRGSSLSIGNKVRDASFTADVQQVAAVSQAEEVTCFLPGLTQNCLLDLGLFLMSVIKCHFESFKILLVYQHMNDVIYSSFLELFAADCEKEELKTPKTNKVRLVSLENEPHLNKITKITFSIFHRQQQT